MASLLAQFETEAITIPSGGFRETAILHSSCVAIVRYFDCCANRHTATRYKLNYRSDIDRRPAYADHHKGRRTGYSDDAASGKSGRHVACDEHPVADARRDELNPPRDTASRQHAGDWTVRSNRGSAAKPEHAECEFYARFE